MTGELLVLVFLVLLNGFFAMSELAVVTARKSRLKQLARDSLRARKALELAEHPERFLSTVQVGITLIGILLGFFGGEAIGLSIAGGLAAVWPGLQQYAFAIGVGVAVTLIAAGQVVFGELVPKRLALTNPERFAAIVSLPMAGLSRAAGPAVYLLSATTRLVLRVLGLRDAPGSITEEEIRLLVAEGHEQGVIDADERNMLNRVLRLGDRSVASLMTPRTRIVWLDVDATLEENLAVMRESRYSRYPVFRGSDQEVVGVLEVKSLSATLGQAQPDLFGELREALFVSESMRALNLLERFRDDQQTLALVVDEYGDLQGMVSLNDVLGAILGRIQQHATEADAGEAPVRQRADGSWLIDGGLSTEDLRELLSLGALPGEEDQDYNTVAGMMIARFGRIPHSGEYFDWSGFRFEVVDLDGARIDKLLVQPLREDSGEVGE